MEQSTNPHLIEPPDLAPAVADMIRPEGQAPPEREDAAVTVLIYTPDAPPRPARLAEAATAVRHDELFVWIDLTSYTQDDLSQVARVLHLDPGGVHAALSRWHHPSLQVHGDHFFVSATVASIEGENRVGAAELDIFVGANYLVTAHKTPLPFTQAVADRASMNPNLLRFDAAFMLYIVLDELLAHYESLEQRLRLRTEEMQQQALRDTSDRFLEDLLHLKRFLFALAQLAEAHRTVFQAFLRPDFTYVAGEDVEVYFRDLDARLERLTAQLSGGREEITSAFDIYVSHVAHRTNHVIRILTIVSAVLLPVTVILNLFTAIFAGLTIRAGGPVIVMSVVAALAFITALALFRWKRWI